jgi:hypothetical protein
MVQKSESVDSAFVKVYTSSAQAKVCHIAHETGAQGGQ